MGAKKSNPKIPFAVRKFINKIGYYFKKIKINNIKYCITYAKAKNDEILPEIIQVTA